MKLVQLYYGKKATNPEQGPKEYNTHRSEATSETSNQSVESSLQYFRYVKDLRFPSEESCLKGSVLGCVIEAGSGLVGSLHRKGAGLQIESEKSIDTQNMTSNLLIPGGGEGGKNLLSACQLPQKPENVENCDKANPPNGSKKQLNLEKPEKRKNFLQKIRGYFSGLLKAMWDWVVGCFTNRGSKISQIDSAHPSDVSRNGAFSGSKEFMTLNPISISFTVDQKITDGVKVKCSVKGVTPQQILDVVCDFENQHEYFSAIKKMTVIEPFDKSAKKDYAKVELKLQGLGMLPRITNEYTRIADSENNNYSLSWEGKVATVGVPNSGSYSLHSVNNGKDCEFTFHNIVKFAPRNQIERAIAITISELEEALQKLHRV